MNLVTAWLRLELRRRWRSLAVLAMLIAVSAGVVMTSLAASRRGASSLTRLESRTLPATVLVLANLPGFDWSKVQALPEVAALSKFVVDYSLSIDGVDRDTNLGFPPADDAMLRTIEKPVVYAGRNLNPARADEAVVTREYVSSYHKGVGDTFVLRLPTAKQLADAFIGPNLTKFNGPRITVRIVGVVASPWVSDAPGRKGAIQLSPGVVATHPLETVGDVASPKNTQFVNALVRLKGGEKDVRRFSNGVARVTGRSDIEVTNLAAQGRTIQHHIAFESRCLLAFGGAAFLAALFLVGQAIARYAAASTNELQTLRALGMTPAQATATAAAGPAIVGVLGATVGAAAAWVASSWFPFGTAGYFEPTPGRSWDWLVLGVLALTVFALVVGGAAAAARLALSAARRESGGRRSAVVAAAARASAPVPVLIGARFALETGRGRTAVPVRPALIGAVMGVLGIVAAFTFSHGVSEAAANPARFGQTFQLGAFVGFNGEDFGPSAKVASALVADDRTTGVDDSRTAVATGAGGKASISLFEYRADPKPIDVVALEGRVPTSPDEVMLAPQTMTAMHARVGNRVALTGDRPRPRTFLVTGVGLVPIGPHNGYADGGWISPAGYESLFTGFKFHVILIALHPGADVPKTADALVASVTKAVPAAKGLALDPGEVPIEVALLRQVRTLPIVLGAFLALLAIGAVGHAIATAVRRRSHDLAVLRALGMTQWQCRSVVVTQASVLALVGVMFGLPAGLAIGRTVWRIVADYTPLQYVAPIEFWALLLVGPAALLIANVLAAWPGRRAARMRISHILRTE